MLWQNSRCVVVGRNQYTLAEINLDYIKAHDIPVVRRLSGGGAVFHDLGNLNYTFIVTVHDWQKSSSFEKFTTPILNVLHRLSIRAERSKRNDLTIDGKKFSGTAQYRHRNRLLHHGTLLFSSNLVDLSSTLTADPSRFQGRGIRSTISQVTNIRDYITGELTLAQFRDLIMEQVREVYKDSCLYTLTNHDLSQIHRLMEEKYYTWEWNFGISPLMWG